MTSDATREMPLAAGGPYSGTPCNMMVLESPPLRKSQTAPPAGSSVQGTYAHAVASYSNGCAASNSEALVSENA